MTSWLKPNVPVDFSGAASTTFNHKNGSSGSGIARQYPLNGNVGDAENAENPTDDAV